MSYADISQRPRPPAVVAVVAIHLLLAYAFVTGLAYRFVDSPEAELKTFDVVEPAPPAEEPKPEPKASEAPSPVQASPSPIPTRANPISGAEVRAPAGAGGAAATAATLLRGAFHNESDYPRSARDREEQGTVRVSFTVGADGRVTGCTIVQSSGSSSLDSTTCRIFERRFRYAPARDSAGNPVSQTVRQSVTWQIT